MKKEEIIEKLKRGEKLYSTYWGGRHYHFSNGGSVRYDQIDNLKDKGLVTEYRSKTSPLTGSIKLKLGANK